MSFTIWQVHGQKENDMEKKEFALFASALKTYYPKENLLPNNQAMELWYQQLADIPYHVAEVTLNKWVATNKWSPTIADIREMALSVTRPTEPDWGEGWREVEMAIRKFGMYRIGEAMESFTPITKQCVERLGFRELCLSENSMADRANFRMVYEQLVQRKKVDAQIPAKLSVLIGTLQNNNLMLEQQKKGVE